MAFVAIHNTQLYIQKAALNQADYDTFNLNPIYNKVTISDADFNSLMSEKKIVDSITSNSVTFVDQDHKNIHDSETKVDISLTQDNIENMIKTDLELVKGFLKNVNGRSHRQHWVSRYEAYKTTLEEFDASTLTYPTNKNIYEIFHDNSKDFINLRYQGF